jgi:hypothetical protein
MSILPLSALFLFLVLESGKFYLRFIQLLASKHRSLLLILIEFGILTVHSYLLYVKSKLFLLLILLNLIMTYVGTILNPAISNKTNDDYLTRVLIKPYNNRKDSVMFDATYSLVLFAIYYVNTI